MLVSALLIFLIATFNKKPSNLLESVTILFDSMSTFGALATRFLSCYVLNWLYRVRNFSTKLYIQKAMDRGNII